MARSERQCPIYGWIAEFDQPQEIIEAATKAREQGYKRMEAYSPFPVEGLAQAVGFHTTRLPWIVLCGGLVGCFGGFFMQYFASVIHYPVIVGGRPFNSWPSFMVITFELTILCSALTTVISMLALNGLPKPYHPVFNVPRFELASRNQFFLCIESRDPKFSLDGTKKFLDSLQGRGVYEVAH